MIQFVAKPVAHFALHLGQKQLKEYFGKKIDDTIIAQAQSRIEVEINEAINNVGKKTKIYFILTIINLLILAAVLTLKMTLVTFASTILSFLLLVFYFKTNLTSFLSAITYIENFEKHIKLYVQQGLEEAKNEGWKNKLVLFLDSRDSQDYYHLVLEQIIHGISQWVLNNKSVLYVRAGLYVVATACFSVSLREIFL